MRMKIVKWISIATLFLTAILWPYAAKNEFFFVFLICTGAILVAHQAIQARKHLWVWVFIGIALLFNPLVSILRPPADWSLLAVLVCVIPFAMSLTTLKTGPRLAITSITDKNPRRESL